MEKSIFLNNLCSKKVRKRGEGEFRQHLYLQKNKFREKIVLLVFKKFGLQFWTKQNNAIFGRKNCFAISHSVDHIFCQNSSHKNNIKGQKLSKKVQKIYLTYTVFP